MKRIFVRICACMAVLLLASGLLLQVHAAAELLENGSFETGDMATFFRYGPASTVKVAKEYAHTGEYGLSMTDRQGMYATYAIDVTELITKNGPGTYRVQAWARQAPGASGDKACVVLNFRVRGTTKDQYIASARRELQTDQWLKLSIENVFVFDESIGLEHAYIYVQSYDDSNTAGDIWIDDFSLRKTGEMATGLEKIDVSDAVRDPITSVGVIRWDAWYTHDGVENSVISQVERSLSPARFHFRAPFFARVTEDNKIEIPAYTQEVFDREVAYAASAGIDYFAYLYYSSDMQAARKFHQSSAHKEEVKFCMILSASTIGQSAVRKEMKMLMAQSYYMTVLDGHPLIYYYLRSNDNLSALSKELAYYRTVAQEIGVKPPFVALMNRSAYETNAFGADAVTKYAVGLSGNAPFAELASAAKKNWLSWLNEKTQHIPLVTMGWQNEPRIENNVTWIGAMSPDNYAQYATPKEIEAHLTDALTYVETTGAAYTKANTVLIYAWNEHDEGGWVCPTIAVDEAGRQLFEADGTPKVNDEHLRAVGRAISAFRPVKATETPTDVPTEVPTEKPADTPSTVPEATEKPTDTPATTTPQTDDFHGFSPLWVILPAAGLAVAAAVTATVIVKRRKAK